MLDSDVAGVESFSSTALMRSSVAEDVPFREGRGAVNFPVTPTGNMFMKQEALEVAFGVAFGVASRRPRTAWHH